jgi:membrane-bound serine protease (ClpP class)
MAVFDIPVSTYARRLSALLALSFAMLLLGRPAEAAGQALLIGVDGAISPASADYVIRGIDRADAEKMQLIILRLDTPGGLDTSMRDMIKKMLASPVPVVVWVGPEGARAASAGTYLLYAAHVAAMAPATSVGAATPVPIGIGEPTKAPEADKAKPEAKEKDQAVPAGDAMSRKQVHDAAAYIRGLAQMRGRNAEWAERAVREAVSLTAEEALHSKVIDLIATDTADLLQKLDGRKVDVLGVERTLETKGLALVSHEPDWRTRLLTVITNPSVAYILLLIGMYGLFFEFSNPGFGVAGIAGAICLLLALFAFQLLPVNYAGLGLIVLGMAFMVAEAFVPSFGVLGLGGVIAFVVGSVMLMDTDLPGYGIPWSVVLPVTATTALFVFMVASLMIKSRHRKVVSGVEELPGTAGEVLADMDGDGWAHVHGETWRVRSHTPLKAGQAVRVTRVDGLTLEVEPAGVVAGKAHATSEEALK